VKRTSIIAVVLGLAVLQACSATDDAIDRPEPDAGRDAKPTVRADAQGADRLDASGDSAADGGSTTPPPDAAVPDTATPPPDGPTTEPDVAVPPRPDAPPPPPPDAQPPPPIDAAQDLPQPVSCVVTFTVSGVRWDPPEAGAPDASGAHTVRLVGDVANLGSWNPASGVLLTETMPGTWSGTAIFRDEQLTEFKFVKLEGTTPEWDSWQPYDSNRSLRVECLGDAGTLRDASDAAVTADASSDAADAKSDGLVSNDAEMDSRGSDGHVIEASTDGASDSTAVADGAPDGMGDASEVGTLPDGAIIPVPARGQSYQGVFGVRPPDATK
jgi:hypothetical protein